MRTGLLLAAILPLGVLSSRAQEQGRRAEPTGVQTERRLIRHRQWARLASHYQALIEREPAILLRRGEGPTRVVTTLRNDCHRRIGRLPAAGLDAYRRMADPPARRLMACHRRTGRLAPLVELTGRYFNSSIGDQALLRGAALLMDLGRFEQALRWLYRISPAVGPAPLHFPDSRLQLPVVRQRAAACLAALGATRELAARFADVPGCASMLAQARRSAEWRSLRPAWSITARLPARVEDPWWRPPGRPPTRVTVHRGRVYWRSPTAILAVGLEDGRVLARYPVGRRLPADLLRATGARTVAAVHRWRQHVDPVGNAPVVIWPWLFSLQDSAPFHWNTYRRWLHRMMAHDLRAGAPAAPVEVDPGTDRFTPLRIWLASPVADAERIYLPVLRKQFEIFCLDRKTLQRRWRVRIKLTAPDTRQGTLIQHGSGVLVHRGRVYWDTQRGSILCLDAATGEERWRARYRCNDDQSPRPARRMTVVDGRLIALPRLGPGLLAIDPRTGATRWIRPLGPTAQWIGASGNLLYVAGHRVRAVAAWTGVEWRRSAPIPRLIGRPAMDARRIWLPTARGLVALSRSTLRGRPDDLRVVNRRAIPAGNLQLAGRHVISASPIGLQVFGPAGATGRSRPVPQVAPPPVAPSVRGAERHAVPHAAGSARGGRALFVAEPSGVTCLEAGRARWKISPRPRPPQPRIHAAQRIARRLQDITVLDGPGDGPLVAQSRFRLSGLHRATGRELWSRELPGAGAPPAGRVPRLARPAPQVRITRNHVVALLPDGRLIGLDRERGEVAWRAALAGFRRGRLHRLGCRLVVLSQDRLTVVEPCSGTLTSRALPERAADFFDRTGPAGTIYLASRRSVRALPAAGGPPRWRTELDGSVRSVRSVGSRLLIELDRRLVLLDGLTGRGLLSLPKAAAEHLVAAGASRTRLYLALLRRTGGGAQILWLVGRGIASDGAPDWRVQLGQTDRLYHVRLRALAGDRCLLGTYSVDALYSGLWLFGRGRLVAAIGVDQAGHRAPWPVAGRHWTVDPRTLTPGSNR